MTGTEYDRYWSLSRKFLDNTITEGEKDEYYQLDAICERQTLKLPVTNLLYPLVENGL
jgi:hypothetical protein